MAKKLTNEDGGQSIPNRTEKDEENLFIHHLDRLRAQGAKVAAAKAVMDAERATLTDLFRDAKTDGFARKELQSILDDSKATRRDLVEEEERRAKLRVWAGLPAGAQPDLFGLPSPARDEIDAEAEGYQAGLRGDDPKPGDHISPNYHQAFMTGWHKAQERRAMAIGGVPANDLTDAEVQGAA